jgi:hypothetical protein
VCGLAGPNENEHRYSLVKQKIRGLSIWLLGENSICCLGKEFTKPYMTGSDVQLVQTKLTESGFTLGTIDGIFGKNTENAVKAFQSSRKILVDGIVGPETWSYLMNSDMPSGNKPIFERYVNMWFLI